MSATEYDFDRPIDRRGSSSTKWEKYRGRDVIPLWVADMDFATAPSVIEALQRRVRHGIFGYTQPPEELYSVISAALLRDYGWAIERDWVIFLPSLVVGLNVVCRAFAAEEEAILTAVPIYPPFLSAPLYSDRACVRVPLRESAGRWCWDANAVEDAVTPRTRVLLLCSPHNPTGRVWSVEELQMLGEVAARHQLVVVSDEIHCGLVLDRDKHHLPFAMANPSQASRTVTLMSASKTFNLPGLGCAFAIVADAQLRTRMQRVMAGIVHHVGALGYFATLAAYRDGRDWQVALCEYLAGNRTCVEQALAPLPFLRTYHSEATYLTWIDARALGEDPVKRFEQAGVGLYDGALFGAPGFVRLNFACPRALLSQALERVQRIVG
jgi:cystathionine beta-lyase